MNKRFWISGVALGIASLVQGFVIHAVLLHGDYAKLPNLFRPEADAGKHFPVMFLAHLLTGFGMTWMNAPGKGRLRRKQILRKRPLSAVQPQPMKQTHSPISRRRFLKTTGAAALLAAHHGLAQDGSTGRAAAPVTKGTPRIRNLELLTAAPLARMKEFYHQSLGLRVVEDKPDRLTLAAGLTRLTFVPAGAEAGNPFYHFAFNIPENKIVAALQWQQARSAMIPVPESLRDSDHPAEVVNYRHWNAHSVFFFDPAQNVVEYIARHDLKNAQAGPFDSRDILYASEIAFIVDDVPATASTLGQAAGMELYGAGGEFFTALGDERGLLLVMKRGRLLSLASPQKKEAGIYRTAAVVRGTHRKQHPIPGFPYEVNIET